MGKKSKKDLALIQGALDTLSEHFDTVHIFVTRHEPYESDGTLMADRGTGNWYARFGQIVEWVEVEKARAIDERKQGIVEEE